MNYMIVTNAWCSFICEGLLDTWFDWSIRFEIILLGQFWYIYLILKFDLKYV